jgi:hypothetical protein
MITANIQLDFLIITKIRTLIQISLKFLIEEEILIEKKNYIKTPKNTKENEFYYKNIFRIRRNLKTKAKVLFSVNYKFFRYPTRVITYSLPIKTITIDNNITRIEEDVSSRTIICGPSFLRAESYNKANSCGTESFKIKNKNLIKIFSEAKFYPDIDFIELLKNEYFNYLDINEIKVEIRNIRLELKKIYEKTN